MVELTRHEGQRGHCGQRLALQPGGGLLDVLSYGLVHLRGKAAGRVMLAVEDRASTGRQESVPLAAVTGPFELTIPLRFIGRQVDVRQLTALVVLTEEPGARVVLEQLELTQAPAAAPRPI